MSDRALQGASSCKRKPQRIASTATATATSRVCSALHRRRSRPSPRCASPESCCQPGWPQPPVQRWPHQHSSAEAASSSTLTEQANEPPSRAEQSCHSQLWKVSRGRGSLLARLLHAFQRAQNLHPTLQSLSVLHILRSSLTFRRQHGLPLILAVGPGATAGQWRELTSNHVFLVGFWAWLFAQTLKIFTRRLKTGIWDVKAIVDSGGMPSSHSALCTSVTTAVGIEFGLGSPLFALALCFTLIVMYDATGVRRHAGKQAEVLNIMLGEILEGHPIRATKLKEVLGHTPLQVAAGAILGVVVGCLFPQADPVVQMSV